MCNHYNDNIVEFYIEGTDEVAESFTGINHDFKRGETIEFGVQNENPEHWSVEPIPVTKYEIVGIKVSMVKTFTVAKNVREMYYRKITIRKL